MPLSSSVPFNALSCANEEACIRLKIGEIKFGFAFSESLEKVLFENFCLFRIAIHHGLFAVMSPIPTNYLNHMIILFVRVNTLVFKTFNNVVIVFCKEFICFTQIKITMKINLKV